MTPRDVEFEQWEEMQDEVAEAHVKFIHAVAAATARRNVPITALLAWQTAKMIRGARREITSDNMLRSIAAAIYAQDQMERVDREAQARQKEQN